MLGRLLHAQRTARVSASAVSGTILRRTFLSSPLGQQTRLHSSAFRSVVDLLLRRKRVSDALVKKDASRTTDIVRVLPLPQREAVTAAAEATAAATAETSSAVSHHLAQVYRQLSPEEVKERRRKENTPAVGSREFCLFESVAFSTKSCLPSQ